MTPPVSPSPLKFSIERILQDDFGSETKGSVEREEMDQRVTYPAWVYCTRYSDRPTSGTRGNGQKRKKSASPSEKRPRTAFSPLQLSILKQHFIDNRYLTEKRRQELAHELGLNESQIKIWFQNKRAKVKKTRMDRPALASLLISHNLCASFNNQ